VQVLDPAVVGPGDEERLRVGRPGDVRPGLAVGRPLFGAGALAQPLAEAAPAEPAGERVVLAAVGGERGGLVLGLALLAEVPVVLVQVGVLLLVRRVVLVPGRGLARLCGRCGTLLLVLLLLLLLVVLLLVLVAVAEPAEQL